MAVPAQVQARGDRADELLKQQASTETPVVGDPAKPEDRDKNQPAPAETVESLKTKLAEAEQKLSTLQGKYNNEIQALKDDVNLLNTLKNQVRQANGQVQEINGKLNEANTLIGQLQKQIAEKQTAETVKPSLSEEDREYLRGEGFEDRTIEIFSKVFSKGTANAGVQGELEKIKQELEQEKARDAERARAKFWSELEEKVSDWATINGDRRVGTVIMPEFDTWLDGTLPYSSKTRRDALMEAQAAWDYKTAIQIFNDFKSANPKKKPEHQIDPAKQIDPASSVVNQQDPAGQVKPAGKLYTRQEVKDFYKDLSLGKYKGKEDEAKRIDADILLANNEGRIQG